MRKKRAPRAGKRVKDMPIPTIRSPYYINRELTAILYKQGAR